MSQQELLKKVVSVLDTLGVDYMLTGSLVSSLQGEPRATHDIDLVVDFDLDHFRGLVRSFPPPDYHVSESAATDAIRRETMFNLIDTQGGDKVDFWILRRNDPFDRSRFSRRRRQDLLAFAVYVSSPEDTILMKLRWAKMSGGSVKQLTDAIRIFEVQQAQLDFHYIEQWVSSLALGHEWQELLAQSNPL